MCIRVCSWRREPLHAESPHRRRPGLGKNFSADLYPPVCSLTRGDSALAAFCAVPDQNFEQNPWHVRVNYPSLPSLPRTVPLPGLRTAGTGTCSSALPGSRCSHPETSPGGAAHQLRLRLSLPVLPSWALGWAPSELGAGEQLALKNSEQCFLPKIFWAFFRADLPERNLNLDHFFPFSALFML